VTQPPSGDENLYVVEQGGRVRRLEPDGTVSTFLDISDEVSDGSEQGLLSLAFAPDYARSGLLYVDYTNLDGDTRIVEYRAEDGEVDESSAREVLSVDQPFENHNGGLVTFGPDGDLYIGLGDGGSGNDPQRNALDLTSPLGKILRIDPLASGARAYTIPPDNPFATHGDALPEVFAYGLRNPWRFAFDEESGTLTIGDVGQDAEEEVDVVAIDDAAGADFGWSAFEGDQRLNEDQSAPDAIPPALVATHEDGNCSVTGGLVVRDRDLPTLLGRYLYGDLCLGELRSFTPVPGERAADDTGLGQEVDGLSSFGEDAAGNVYATSISGPVYRVDPAP
jgi:glucose/arabinose dehydrogenase